MRRPGTRAREDLVDALLVACMVAHGRPYEQAGPIRCRTCRALARDLRRHRRPWWRLW